MVELFMQDQSVDTFNNYDIISQSFERTTRIVSIILYIVKIISINQNLQKQQKQPYPLLIKKIQKKLCNFWAIFQVYFDMHSQIQQNSILLIFVKLLYIRLMQEQTIVTATDRESLNGLLMKKNKNPIFLSRKPPHSFLAFKPAAIRSKNANKTHNFAQLLFDIKQQLKQQFKNKKLHLENTTGKFQQSKNDRSEKQLSLKLKNLNSWLNCEQLVNNTETKEKPERQVKSVGENFMSYTLNKWKANCLQTKNKGVFQLLKKNNKLLDKSCVNHHTKTEGNENRKYDRLVKNSSTYDTIPVHTFNHQPHIKKPSSAHKFIQDALHIRNNITFNKNYQSNQTRKNFRKLRMKSKQEISKKYIKEDQKIPIKQLSSKKIIATVVEKTEKKPVQIKPKEQQNTEWIFQPW